MERISLVVTMCVEGFVVEVDGEEQVLPSELKINQARGLVASLSEYLRFATHDAEIN